MLQAADEMTLEQLDRASIVERLKKAYVPVTTKTEGTWTVSNADTTETWTYKGGTWTCPNSRWNCADFVPLSFKWMGSGKNWLAVGAPQRRVQFDFEGSARGVAERGATPMTEEDESGPALKFEGKRNALEVWEWESSLASGLRVSISLRDYLIERLQYSGDEEILEWAPTGTGKNLALSKILLSRGSEKLVFAKK